MNYLVQFFSWIMDWCQSWCPNYWVDIVVFTLITKILQYPLSLWCHVNSLKMVSIMPEAIRIKIEFYGDSEAIGDKTAELFKREHYHPLLSLIPLAIQIVILMGFVKVIYNIAGVDQSAIRFSSVNDIPLIARVPVSHGGVAWVMPILAGGAALLLGYCQNRISPLQREQSEAQQRITNGISVAISLLLGCFVGMGVGLYWAASNLFSIVVQLCCNATVRPKSRIDYPSLRRAQFELQELEQSLRREVSPEDKKRELADYRRFFNVANKHVVFYAEGGGFYKYFKSLIEWLLQNSNIIIHYVTNDPKDGVFLLAEENPHIRAYYIGQMRIIPLMMKMDADMVVMTTPDLGQYHIKRSYVRKDIEYIYLCHGPTSVNMCTRRGAYDNFDTVFSNGEYQTNEFRALERIGRLKEKKIVPTGYIYFDTLFAGFKPVALRDKKRIMIAPSYQAGNIFESCLDEIVKVVSGKDRVVVLRPHPQYVKRHPDKAKAIESRYAARADVELEFDFSKPSTMEQSDIVVTDWSGIACEFAFTTGKPCIFIDTPMKVINPDYEKTGLVPTEISFRNRLGRSFSIDCIEGISVVVEDMLANSGKYSGQIKEVLETMYYNPGRAGEIAGKYILDTLIKKQEEKRK